MQQSKQASYPLQPRARRWRLALPLVYLLFTTSLAVVVIFKWPPVPDPVGQSAAVVVVFGVLLALVHWIVNHRSSRARAMRALAKDVDADLARAEWAGAIPGLRELDMERVAPSLVGLSRRHVVEAVNPHTGRLVLRKRADVTDWGWLITVHRDPVDGPDHFTVSCVPSLPTLVFDFGEAKRQVAAVVLALRTLGDLTGSVPATRTQPA